MVSRLVALATLPLATAGCFRPLYAELGSPGSPAGPGNSSVRAAFAAIEVAPVQGSAVRDQEWLAVEMRNAVVQELTGGAGGATPSYRLAVILSATRSPVIVNPNTARQEFENYGLDATYVLTEIGSDRRLAQGAAFARVSFDSAQQQRFARARAFRDAQVRATQTLAEQIKLRLAPLFVARG
jgi:LPS-assembly lipoprotein